MEISFGVQLSIFVFLMTSSVFIHSQDEADRKANICKEQKTCGACVAAGPDCGWCKQEGYDNKTKERCDVVKNLYTNGCDKKFVVMPDHEDDYPGNLAPRNAEEGKDAVQLSPQEMVVKIRPNKPFEFSMQFRQAENYPVDLYVVMDLSYSMRDDKDKLAELGELLAEEMSKITKNFRLGFGSFIDKKTMPYVSTTPGNLREPCTGCVAPYGFKNQLSLTDDTSQFRSKVQDAEISGNLDAPEGGFDAMMQAIVCKTEIGWRANSRKMLLFSTDELFHTAGDGKLGGIVLPNDGHCHMVENVYSESLNQDYPSISQISKKVIEEKVNVIFAVTENQVDIYKKLSHFIEGSVTGELANDSSNIVELVNKNYAKISSVVEMKTENSEGVYVKFQTKCKKDEDFKDIAKCDNVSIGQNISYKVTIQVTDCPENKEDWEKTISIYPVGLTEKLNIKLSMICECPCELPENEVPNSPICEGSGTYECGACTCDEGFYGKRCECDGSTVANKDYDAACKQTNTSSICEGHGECVCGECHCFPVSPGDVSKKYSGTYCECDDYSCDYYDNMLCGGSKRGRCNCGICACLPGFVGDACECPESQEACVAKNGKICNGVGKCKCGRCVCNKEDKYRGPTCEDCPTCPGKCEANKACVQCMAFGTGEIEDEDHCKSNCSYIQLVDQVEEKDGWRLCRARDESDGCYFYFIYEIEYNGDNVEAQKTKECPKPVNILAIVLGVIFAILLIGLLLLLLWKCIVTLYDRREYAKFEKEVEKAKWDMAENPIFKPATSTYKNPMK